MEYVCTWARFSFFDGKNIFTVEFSYGIMTWFVFKDSDVTDAVFKKKIGPPGKTKSPNREAAGDVLDEYLSN